MADKYLKENGTQLLVSLVKNSVNNALSKLNYYSEGNNTATTSANDIYVTSESNITIASTNGEGYINIHNGLIAISTDYDIQLNAGNDYTETNGYSVNVYASNFRWNGNDIAIRNDFYYYHENTSNGYALLHSNNLYLYGGNVANLLAGLDLYFMADASINAMSGGYVNVSASGNINLNSVNDDIYLNTFNGTAYYNGNEIATVNLIKALQEKIDDLTNFTFKASFNYNAHANIQLLSLDEAINVNYSGYSVNNGANYTINTGGTSGIGNTNMSYGNVAVRVDKGVIQDAVYSFLMLSSNTDNISVDTCTSNYFKFISSGTNYSSIKSLHLCPLTFAPNSSSCFYNWMGVSDFNAIENCATGHIENAYRMFGNCFNITYANWVENMSWNSVTSAANMFYNCLSLLTISINSATSNGNGLHTNIHFENVTNASSMFYNCVNLSFTGHQSGNGYANGFYTNWPTTTLYFNSATNMTNMFRNCSNLSGMIILHCGNVTCAANMFNGAGYFANLNFPTVFVAVDNSSIRNVILNGMSGATNAGDYYTYQNVRLYDNSIIMMNDCNHRIS